MTSINEVRKEIFLKHSLDALPPTKDALEFHIHRANYQSLVWYQCLEAVQQLPNPTSCGWMIDDESGDLIPKLMSLSPLPNAYGRTIRGFAVDRSDLGLALTKSLTKTIIMTEFIGMFFTKPIYDKSKIVKESTPDYTGGLRDVKTTGVFRAVNFELFVKPNKFIMGFGIAAITGCVAYIAYMRAEAENRKEETYVAIGEDGEGKTTRKRSRWD
ncbi:Small integral membrane protein 8 [Nymphon striatum]|nr:Small integral membrane protein 8 [Nymphon striatum]